jgi:hypothetical protein
VNSGKRKQTTHGDRYDENRPYSISSYVREYLLSQLNYVIGKINWQKLSKIFP